MDCSQELTLVVDAEGRTVRLHSSTPDKVEFLRYTTAVGTALSCGRITSLPVSITYRPEPSGTSLGDPIRVEFIEELPR